MKTKGNTGIEEREQICIPNEKMPQVIDALKLM